MLELNRLYKMDCMEGMKEFPDKYFDLAIVDPPYGIGESGEKNHTRSRLATSKNYKEFFGQDKDRHLHSISMNCSGLVKIK